MRHHSHTPQDPSHMSGTLASDDSFVQLRGDWDKIESGASTGHLDARDGHDIQGVEATLYALQVV